MIKEFHTREIAAGIPGAKLVNIKGDHFIVVRRPLEFNRAVGAFLDPVMAMSCWTFWRRKKWRSAGCLQSLDWGNAPGDLRIHYEIRDLHQVLELV